jgi:hypothetical protein
MDAAGLEVVRPGLPADERPGCLSSPALMVIRGYLWWRKRLG